MRINRRKVFAKYRFIEEGDGAFADRNLTSVEMQGWVYFVGWFGAAAFLFGKLMLKLMDTS
jgi:hypothetical protein